MKKILRMATAILIIVAQLPFSILAVNDDKTSDAKNILISDQEIIMCENDERIFNFTVQEEKKYSLFLTYECVKGKNSSPIIGVAFDNSDPVSDEQRHTLPRVWASKSSPDGSKRFEQDRDGNELAPSQEEKFEKQTVMIPLSAEDTVELSRGSHKLRLFMVLESVKITKIVLRFATENISYENYISNYKDDETKNLIKRREAELVTTKSDLNIVTTFDRSLPSICPSSFDKIRYNIFGGSSWSKEGQWVTWDIDIPEDGLYNIDIVYRQNVLDGITVRRKIYIDGTVPFSEMECVEFGYSKDFTTKTLADKNKNPYKFYFTKGIHNIKMEVVLGNAKKILKQFRSSITELNSIYSKINVIMGNQSDIYRDYDLDESIPGLVYGLIKQSNEIDEVVDFLNGRDTSGGSHTARMLETSRMLKRFAEKPDLIPKQLDYFRTQINTLADVLSAMMSQPIELDYFTFRSSDKEAQKIDNGFFKYLSFRIKAFAASFVSGYSLGHDKNEYNTINVWVSSNELLSSGFSSGRDQSQVINQLTSNDFAVKNKTNVKVSLISATDTLMQAVASGKGPEVVLLAPKNVIANLYFRGALVDLTQLPHYDDIVKRYYKSALVSLQDDNKLYALPEIQMFNMLFYRKDIFEQQELNVPKTWNEFYNAVFRLQKSGLQVGITESQMIFEMFLLQNGLTLYNDNKSTTRLKEKAAVEAFTSWTELYSKYGFPLSFDMLNRFRTGLMPMTIAPYYFYSQVSVGAPEIENLWSMAPIPGVEKADGSINNAESCFISGSIVLKKKSNKYDSAFKFIEWWAETSVQNKYAFECETRVGISARHSPANKETLNTISWTQDDYKALSAQMKSISDIPQTPASYFVTRNLSNAYRRVVYDYENPRDVIYRYGQDIDNELSRKRKELGIN